MIYTVMLAAAILLEDAEKAYKEKTGYGNSIVRSIAQSLRRGDICSAQLQWYNDGDKLAKPLRDSVIRLLGCRLHHTHDCQNWICKG
jgi:hypothetical protein